MTTTSAPTDGTYFGAGRQLSVICGESPNPTSNEVSAEQARISYARAGLNAWPWVAFCQGWTITADDPYLGPWDTATANPVLVVGNTGDPATAYASSQRMADELDAAELLTVDGYGHTQLANPSTCAQAHIARYLIELTLPPPEARCAQDVQPFS